MSKPHAITDDAILDAWGGADEDTCRPVMAERLRALVESEATGRVLLAAHDGELAGKHRINVDALRNRLGGWDAVWRAVLVDEGFEPLREPPNAWELGLPRAGLVLRIGPDGWELLVAGLKDSIPLRSPADLQARVGHARGLFGG